MAEIQPGDYIQYKRDDGRRTIGKVLIVKDYNGDAHVRLEDDDWGVNIIPTSELFPIGNDEVES
ncbi:hypothetical protein ACI3EX_16785 [Ornithinimicrobium sp. LYQ131]